MGHLGPTFRANIRAAGVRATSHHLEPPRPPGTASGKAGIQTLPPAFEPWSASRSAHRHNAVPRRRAERFERVNVSLEPRGAYHLNGPSRHEWEHSITELDVLAST